MSASVTMLPWDLRDAQREMVNSLPEIFCSLFSKSMLSFCDLSLSGEVKFVFRLLGKHKMPERTATFFKLIDQNIAFHSFKIDFCNLILCKYFCSYV